MADQPPPLPEPAAPVLRRNDDDDDQQQQQQQQQQQPHSTSKLILIAGLLGVVLLLSVLILLVQVQINNAHLRLLHPSKEPLRSSSGSSDSTGNRDYLHSSKTHQPSDPSSIQDFLLYQQPTTLPATGRARTAAAQSYWNQFRGLSPDDPLAVPWHPLIDQAWDVVDQPENYDFQYAEDDTQHHHQDNNNNNSNDPLHHHYSKKADTKFFALQQAAQLGHPQAQYVYANALASGVLPLKEYDQSSFQQLDVADDFLQAHTRQQQEAWLNWHMAAQSGHIEAAMALAHRYETLWLANTNDEDAVAAAAAAEKKKKTNKATASTANNNNNNNIPSSSFTCTDALPYYQAAAHGIMDQLEVHPQSRAKVLPPTEKHLLYHVHLHGGTSSQLDWHNKPDESLEAIQFYHFKATRVDDPDPVAANTLAAYYHHGYRGVPQNLTLALHYYDVAAQADSWEAAGMAGWFHIFGLGMPPQNRDLHQAQTYFRMGLMEGDLEHCLIRHNRKKNIKGSQKQKQQQEPIPQCEPNCLNGMGLLHVFGVPMAVDVDLDLAMEYFTLAKDMGHADAAYNLAMVTLGWKSNYVTLDQHDALVQEQNQKQQQKEQEDGENSDLDEDGKETKKTDDASGMTHLKLPEFMEGADTMVAGPTQLDMQHAVHYLMSAVQKGHLQARHRLALLYDTGILSSPEAILANKVRLAGRKSKINNNNSYKKEVLPQDCEKALKHYKWIVEQGSPDVLHRLRKAYKEYMAGELESSLIQYMGIAELGNERAQVNAAFLLEQGTCLGLSSTNCHKASVRYWKAAAAVGNAEACLRVGDFYYYGKLRPPQDPIATMWDRPFGWSQHVIFPEKHLPKLLKTFTEEALAYLVQPTVSDSEGDNPATESEGNCAADGGDDESCASGLGEEDDDTESPGDTTARKEEDERDLKMAAHYYRIAAEEHSSPRANFNLAFLHEWGLGLTQDFPLAKRHYDLAASAVAPTGEADLAVQIALWTLGMHESVVRIKMAWEDYWTIGKASPKASSSSSILDTVPRAINSLMGKPVPGGPTMGPTGLLGEDFQHDRKVRKTKMDVIMSHLWTWESLVILALTLVLWILLQRRRQRTRR